MRWVLLIFFFVFHSFASDVSEKSFDPEERLKELGIKLPVVPPPIGNYIHLTRDGNLVYLTGKGPSLPKGGYMKGKLGKELSLEEGQRASRLTIIHLLSVLKSEIGSLSKIEKILKVNAAVNSTDEFKEHPKVIDGASNLLTDLFGKKIGQHARSVYGVNSLPMGIPVEIDMIVKIKN